MGIEALYETAYNSTYAEMQGKYETIAKDAPDKLFAAAYVHTIYSIQYTINNNTLLSERIRTYYIAARKLGMKTGDLILGIPEIIEGFKVESVKMNKNPKADITGTKIEGDKLSGIDLKRLKLMLDPNDIEFDEITSLFF